MHYLAAGSGPPVVFLRELPTSSSRWRKILTVMDAGAAGHFLPEDRPTEVAAALSTWLEA
jgi:pimeloyl-ACP methyl ester carboxylesterase